MEVLALTMQGSQISFDHSQILGTELLFSPLKLLLLVLWIYLCMYSVLRIEYSPLVSKKYKAIANVFGLLIGPFILFDLAVADAAKRVQAGEIGTNYLVYLIPLLISSVNYASKLIL